MSVSPSEHLEATQALNTVENLEATKALTLPRQRPGTGASQWHQLGVTVRLVVAKADRLAAAERMLRDDLLALDVACSRVLPDSEVTALQKAQGQAVTVSEVFAGALECALEAARTTDGLLDPTLARAKAAPEPADAPTGRRGRALRLLRRGGKGGTAGQGGVPVGQTHSWKDVTLDRANLSASVPAGVLLDLRATYMSYGADRCAARLAEELGCGVLVAVGGDVATAGRAPGRGWTVGVAEEPQAGGPGALISLAAGGISTAGGGARTWARAEAHRHHVVDPATGAPVPQLWQQVSVAGASCSLAGTLSTTAVVLGEQAVGWLTQWNVPCRLVAVDGRVTTLGGWPVKKPRR